MPDRKPGIDISGRTCPSSTMSCKWALNAAVTRAWPSSVTSDTGWAVVTAINLLLEHYRHTAELITKGRAQPPKPPPTLERFLRAAGRKPR
jgi:hypothetical protein